MKFKPFAIILVALTLSCTTTRTSMLVADRYEDKNITTLAIIPYGNIDIPGHWTKTGYNEVSKQHFFVDKDSTSLAVAKNPQENYPFYAETMTDSAFTREFYHWEKEYYEEKGSHINEVASNGNFVVWTAKGNDVNTIFLLGAKNNHAYNFAIFGENWSEEERIEFLLTLFDMNSNP